MHRQAIALIILLISYQWAFSQVQVRARADKDQILIGQPFNYTIEAFLPPNSSFQWPQIDSINGFNILTIYDADSSDVMDVRKIVQNFTITSYDTGLLTLQPVRILVNKTPYFTDSVYIQVDYAPFNAQEDYRDIRSIIEIPHPFAKYLPWLIGILAVVTLLLAIWLLSRKKNTKAEAQIKTTPLTALEKAILKLKKLKHHSSEPVKYYYASMNEILKTYLNEAFDIHSKDKTNSEILESILQVTNNRDMSDNVRKALEISDYVKFAKLLPDDRINEENKNIIIQTITLLDKYKLK